MAKMTQKSVSRELRAKYGDVCAREFHLVYTHGARTTLVKARALAIRYVRECNAAGRAQTRAMNPALVAYREKGARGLKRARKDVPVAKADAEARAKKAGVPLDFSGMKRAGVRVSAFNASRGLVYLRRRAPRTERLEYSVVPFQKVGGVWIYLGGDSAWRPVGMGGR